MILHCLDSLSKYEALIDLKITGNANEFEKKCVSFRYHVQAAYYLWGCKSINMNVKNFIFIIVERDAPHGVRVCELDRDSLRLGEELARQDLMTYAACLEKNNWPDYKQAIEIVGLPKYAYYKERS